MSYQTQGGFIRRVIKRGYCCRVIEMLKPRASNLFARDIPDLPNAPALMHRAKGNGRMDRTVASHSRGPITPITLRKWCRVLDANGWRASFVHLSG
jgi:hypothetical protein